MLSRDRRLATQKTTENGCFSALCRCVPLQPQIDHYSQINLLFQATMLTNVSKGMEWSHTLVDFILFQCILQRVNAMVGFRAYWIPTVKRSLFHCIVTRQQDGDSNCLLLDVAITVISFIPGCGHTRIKTSRDAAASQDMANWRAIGLALKSTTNFMAERIWLQCNSVVFFFLRSIIVAARCDNERKKFID